MPSVTTHNSYGSRVGNSFKNILWGIILVIVSICLLAWNENNYAKQKAALKEWAEVVQETTADQINPELEWKEVHLYGQTASNAEALQDSVFGIVTDDLKLQRTVEMYQWYEESSESCTDNYGWSQDCTTTYDYHKKWSEESIDSSKFYETAWHSNPTNWAYNSTEQEKSPITLWVYTLTPEFTQQLTDYKTINLAEQNVKVPAQYQVAPAQPTTTTTTNEQNNNVEDNNNEYLYWDTENNQWSGETVSETSEAAAETSDSVKDYENFHITDSYIYIWANPTEPAIWDLKISFSSVKTWTISIVWKQMWNELTSYKVSNWRNINLLSQGNVSAEDMFLEAQKANKIMTWILRLVGLLLMYCGFAMIFQFIETIAKVLPFLADIIGVWTWIIALWLTLAVGFITIAIAWLAVRPIIWICCLVVAAGGIFLLIKSKKNKSSSKETTNEIIES